MDSFWDVFVRPLTPVVTVAGFLFAGGASWPLCVAAGFALYVTFLEIQRASGFGRRS